MVILLFSFKPRALATAGSREKIFPIVAALPEPMIHSRRFFSAMQGVETKSRTGATNRQVMSSKPTVGVAWLLLILITVAANEGGGPDLFK